MPKGTCLQGHDASLNDKIKDVIRAEDGTRVLVSYNNTSLGKDFRTYACVHDTRIYVLKKTGRESPHSLQILPDKNPCPKKHRYEPEAYNSKDTLFPKSRPPEDNTSDCRAEMNLENCVYGSAKKIK